LFPSSSELLRIAPELILTAAATLLMMIDALGRRPRPALFSSLSAGALLVAGAGALWAYRDPGPAFSGMVLVDGFATFFRLLVITVGFLTVVASHRYLRREGADAGEYNALLLYSIVGQSVMAAGNELILIFIGLEISSISSYVLAGYLRDDRRGNEAALKYFLLGSFATAFLLYGVALIYGAAGSTSLPAIRATIARAPGLLVAISAALMFVGIGFKVSAAPFQMWAPDVYQGAPSPVAAFLSAGPKAAAFAVLLRVFLTAFEPIGSNWEPLVWISALLSMTIGNFAALMQSDVKRLLAYSSIAHAGYVLVAVTARSQVGVAAAMFYLLAYAFMNLGAFAAVTHLAGKRERYLKIEDFAGLGAKQPLTAALMALFLLSLIGVPLTGGFFGKFYIFKAALDSDLVWLTVLALLNSAVAAYYYLRLLVVMYMNEPGEASQQLEPLTGSLRAALVIPALATLILGIFPGAVLDFAVRSTWLLR